MPEGTGEEEPGETQTPASRYWLTNDALAAWIMVTLPLMLLLAAAPWPGLSFEGVPTNWILVYALAAGAATAWAFGSGAVSGVLDRIGG